MVWAHDPSIMSLQPYLQRSIVENGLNMTKLNEHFGYLIASQRSTFKRQIQTIPPTMQSQQIATLLKEHPLYGAEATSIA